MRSVWKYTLALVDDALQGFTMPENSKILHVDNQDGIVTMWAEVETTARPIMRSFRVHGTGHPIPDGEIYVGTVIKQPFVWHLYEVI